MAGLSVEQRADHLVGCSAVQMAGLMVGQMVDLRAVLMAGQ